MRIGGIVVLVIAVFFGLTIFGGSWYTVDEGYRGIILRNGALTGVAKPGLGFKMPLVDTVRDISIQENSVVYDNVMAYSQDQQTATMRISVNYQLVEGELPNIYASYQNEENVLSRLVQPRTFQELKTVFGKFNAANAIGQREKLNVEVQNAIQKAVSGPVLVKSVQIENIDFSDAYENSIEQRMLAEVEVQKLRQNAERTKVEAEITVTQAKAQADSQLAIATAQAEATLVKAKADAEATKLAGEATAEAIRDRVQALGENANAIIALTQAEKWSGQLPTTMVPGSAVPFLGVK
jgi:regulator of protease activity HflC (stomatin/prohibitin superfamily)